jgi:hypothetical protein
VDNKKEPFRSRLLAKLQLGKENKGGSYVPKFKNLPHIFFHEDTA